ncbi:phage tail tape measure protein [Hoylesella timonensis]|uniref:Phage tail tape measure protein n=1 Tax=Hoylesella timonensis TaxID=386414 RepID=A0A2N6Q6V0_9BACT|nr:phage tail tape measure protein [Hoylesella timonensis]PMC10729.1 phage tail tape measure protein [Hoylesella timonensis]
MSNKQISLTVKLNVDGKEQLVTATTDIEKLRAALDASQGSISKAVKNMSYLSVSFLGISSAANQICGTLNNLTEENRTFSGAMAAANTMAGKSGKDFEQLKDKVADLAAELPIARDQLANGLYQVISNGVPEDNWIDYLKKSAKASIGGIADLGETVKVTSTVIKNYGLDWSAANEIQDKIQLTAKNGVTSFEQLAQSLPMVTGNAATLGISVNELMASFATLTGVSGNTAEVATQLSAVFTSLVKPSSEATKQAQEMGIQFDAAAIKAAGGMQNFLLDLDKNVKAYAAKTGQLEQTIYSKLFGSARAMRALIPITGELSEKFGQNVEAMKDSAGTIDDAFGIMAGTGSAKIQKLKNAIADMTDGITSKLSVLRPALNISAEVGNTVVAVFAMNKALKAFGVSAMWTAVRIKGLNFAVFAGKQTLKDLRAVATVASASMRGAAVSVDMMKSAIRGLLVTSVVGLAIWALSAAIGYLIGKMNEAEDGMNGMSEAEQQAKQATEQMNKEIAGVRTEYDLNIQKLKEFKGSREEEKKLVKEMCDKYGEAMGYYSTVSQWYDALTANSAAYCDQMIKEIELRKLANDVASKQAEMDDILYDENGKKRRYSTKRKKERVSIGQVDAGDGKIIAQYKYRGKVGSSDVEQAQEKYNQKKRERDAVKKRMYAINNRHTGEIKKTKGWKPERAGGAGVTNKANAANETNKTNKLNQQTPKTIVDKWRDELSRLEKAKENALTVDAKVKIDEKIGTLQKKIDEATKGKVSIGAEVEPTYIQEGSTADKRQSRSNAESRASRIQQDYEIGIIGKEEAERQLGELNEQLQKLGLKPVEIHFKSHVEELQDALQKAQKELENGTTVEAKIEAAVKMQKLQAEINAETSGKLSIEAEVTPVYVQKGSNEDKRQSYENAMQRANSLKSDVEIGLVGADEARTQLDAINEQLKKLGLEPIELKIESKEVEKAREKLSYTCDTVSQLGSSFSGLGKAVELPALDIAGTMAQAIAAMIEGYATASAASGPMGPIAWLAFAATGLAQLTAMISSVQSMSKFASGGIVGGSSTHGDRKFARVNSGEMILNKSQQTQLFNLINGRFTPPSVMDRRMQPVVVQPLAMDMAGGASPVVNVNVSGDMRKMMQVMTDMSRVASKSGKRYF